MATLTRSPRLSLEDLDVSAPTAEAQGDMDTIHSLASDDGILTAVRSALSDGYAGVIFRGPPGTSKSWYARHIATLLASESGGEATFVQFHPSYQYEDFIEGWTPSENGSFELQPKVFLKLCEDAQKHPSSNFVLVIDEISRCDSARIFGEALTYLEKSKRGLSFRLSSGRAAVIPNNLIIIGTMNPWDRGVDEMDVALLRRFAQIDMNPDPSILRSILEENGLDEVHIAGAVDFLSWLQKHRNPMLHIGHAYFASARDFASLQRLWEFQLHAHFRQACRLEPDDLKAVEAVWRQRIKPEATTLTPELAPPATPESAPGEQ